MMRVLTAPPSEKTTVTQSSASIGLHIEGVKLERMTSMHLVCLSQYVNFVPSTMPLFNLTNAVII